MRLFQYILFSVFFSFSSLLLAGDSAVPVNINKADAATLSATLKGIGPSKAEAIVAYRDSYGPFRSVDELAAVKGIGESLLDQNRKGIALQ
jgi:competence protein ComEA